ncbi:MAG: S-layer homology domain-containing protein [Acidimicrobiaceae bacterium]|nr:S-layer homology domain-containing protein [Acidimicrobiaceae bacterium]
MWVPDRDDDKLYAYSLSTGSVDPDRELSLAEENSDPAGIWSDGTTVWVVDSSDEHVFAYALESGESETAEEYELGLSNPGHVELFGLAEDNDCPADMWVIDETIWVVDWCHDRVFAYDRSSGSRQPDNDLELTSDNADPAGLWSDGETVWVLDSTQDKLFAYTLSTGARSADMDLVLDADNDAATGLWSDGDTVWAADISADKLFAYTLSTGARAPDEDLVLDSENDIAVGLWSDGETMWVADITDSHIYAYSLSTGSRDAAKDIKLASDNSGVWGIWSDGTIMLAVDRFDAKLYAYSVSVPGPGFADVNPVSYSFDFMELLYRSGIVVGTSPSTYSPTEFATREQVAAMLARTYQELTGSPAEVVPTGFVDIASSFAADDIARIYGLGITTGTSDTTFSPGEFVTREQVAAMLARMYELISGSAADAVLTGFVDIASSFAADDIARIYGLGITTGTSDTTFSPDDFATREQMAAFIGRLIRVL